MYKKIVEKIIAAETIADLNKIDADIDKAFENKKITWNDHEKLFDLIAKVSGGYYFRSGVKHITPDYTEQEKI